MPERARRAVTRHILAGFVTGLAAISAVTILSPDTESCAVVGDSIAFGFAQLERGCAASARVGRSAGAIARHPIEGRFRWGVISAGSNNPLDPNLRDQLRLIRANLHADIVIWILPAHPRAAAIARAVAAERGDLVQAFAAGRDRVHPGSYPALRRDVRARLS